MVVEPGVPAFADAPGFAVGRLSASFGFALAICEDIEPCDEAPAWLAASFVPALDEDDGALLEDDEVVLDAELGAL